MKMILMLCYMTSLTVSLAEAKAKTDCLLPGCARSGMFEGDIVVGKGNIAEISALYGIGKASNAATPTNYRPWPKKGNFVRVPYKFSKGMSATKKLAIRAGMKRFREETCVKFIRRRKKEENYIQFVETSGCSSYVGRQKSWQQVSIANGCQALGTVVHELMHAIGFWHEQSRDDRDDHVIIVWKNIPKGSRFNFRTRETESFGSPYDVKSAMHYGSYDFSINSDPAITDLDGNPLETQSDDFSSEDIKQINAKYNCTLSQ